MVRAMLSARTLRSLVLLTLLAAASACGSSDATPDGSVDAGPDAASDGAADATADAAMDLPRILGGDRPARVIVPPDYDGSESWPVVLLLHGYTASGLAQDAYFRMSQTAREQGFLLLRPDGTTDTGGNRFWNATARCCDFGGTGVDDVGYLREILAELAMHYNVDADRVYLVGHSNGGFMSYRMACDASDVITAIASLAGATWSDTARCGDPARPVSVLQIHGTNDATIAYETIGAELGAQDSVERFAERAGCNLTGSETLDNKDLDTSLSGAETDVVVYRDGCAAGVDYALWTIDNGGHIPSIQPDFSTQVYEWLSTHSR